MNRCGINNTELFQEQSHTIEKQYDGSVFGQLCSKTLVAWPFLDGTAASGELSVESWNSTELKR